MATANGIYTKMTPISSKAGDNRSILAVPHVHVQSTSVTLPPRHRGQSSAPWRSCTSYSFLLKVSVVSPLRRRPACLRRESGKYHSMSMSESIVAQLHFWTWRPIMIFGMVRMTTSGTLSDFDVQRQFMHAMGRSGSLRSSGRRLIVCLSGRTT